MFMLRQFFWGRRRGIPIVIIVIVTFSENEFPVKLSTFFTFIAFMELLLYMVLCFVVECERKVPGKKACFDFVTSSVIKNTLVPEDFLEFLLHERGMKRECELRLASRLFHAGGNQEDPWDQSTYRKLLVSKIRDDELFFSLTFKQLHYVNKMN